MLIVSIPFLSLATVSSLPSNITISNKSGPLAAPTKHKRKQFIICPMFNWLAVMYPSITASCNTCFSKAVVSIISII